MTPPPAASAAPRLRRAPGGALPRRVSGPARVPAGRIPVARPQQDGLGANLWRRFGLLLDSPVLGRLISGRGWIAIVGTALIGLVFFQVSLLKLNSGIGRAVERSSALERQNAALRASVSRLGSNDRIQASAAKLGMVLPASGQIRFLTEGGRQLGGGDAAALAAGASIASGSTATLPTLPGATATTTAPGATTAVVPSATTAGVTPTAVTVTPNTATATVAPTTSTATPVQTAATPTVAATPATATPAPATATAQAAVSPAGGAVAPGQQGG